MRFNNLEVLFISYIFNNLFFYLYALSMLGIKFMGFEIDNLSLKSWVYYLQIVTLDLGCVFQVCKMKIFINCLYFLYYLKVDL